ncbi:hypothetical protein V8C86DRAFT_3028539 [Haematococcus lacustris]
MAQLSHTLLLAFAVLVSLTATPCQSARLLQGSASSTAVTDGSGPVSALANNDGGGRTTAVSKSSSASLSVSKDEMKRSIVTSIAAVSGCKAQASAEAQALATALGSATAVAYSSALSYVNVEGKGSAQASASSTAWSTAWVTATAITDSFATAIANNAQAASSCHEEDVTNTIQLLGFCTYHRLQCRMYRLMNVFLSIVK